LPDKVRLGGNSDPAPTGTGLTGASSSANSTPTKLSSGPETAPLPPAKPGEVHVQVDAPFVFSAKDRAAASAATTSSASQPPPVQPVPIQVAKDLRPDESSARTAHLDMTIQPPPKQHPGFFHRVKGFFSAIFR
jgi:hypothetical protein